MRHSFIASLILIVFAAYDVQNTASATDLVKFNSAPLAIGKTRQRPPGQPTNPPDAAIEGYLSKPAGNGPFPAIVYLHGCGGLSEDDRNRVTDLMTGWGYVSLSVDSFSTRGIKEGCVDPLLSSRQGDALGALLYLSKLRFVDPKRIAVMGASQGGIVSLQIASTRALDQFAVPGGLKFRAVVAYYPLCNVATRQLSIPTIILIGELDDWTPAKDCEGWMARRAGKGAPVRLVVYPGAYHGFDMPFLREGVRYLDHWLKYDADAAQRSVLDLHDFLTTELAK